MTLTFDFDQLKADANLRIYNVSFEDAKNALLDPNAVTRIQQHGKDKLRYITLGKINPLEAIIVIWTIREEKIRIISARPAYSFRRAHKVSKIHPLARLQAEHRVQSEITLNIDAKTAAFIYDCSESEGSNHIEVVYAALQHYIASKPSQENKKKPD